MKLIVGLGNPGEKYVKTRHNVGFWVVDQLVSDQAWKVSQESRCWYFWLDGGNKETEVVKPQTFMNQSGESVLSLKRKHPELKDEGILVIHDDLDIPLGTYKLQLSKGPRQHNGIFSIEQELGTKDFCRLRVGVEGRIGRQEPISSAGGSRIKGEEYVLSEFTGDEIEKLEEIMPQIRRSVEKWIES